MRTATETTSLVLVAMTVARSEGIETDPRTAPARPGGRRKRRLLPIQRALKQLVLVAVPAVNDALHRPPVQTVTTNDTSRTPGSSPSVRLVSFRRRSPTPQRKQTGA